MRRLKSAWAWVARHARAILAALVLALGIAGLFQRRRLGRLQDELALARAKKEIAELRERRALLEGYTEASAAEIERIDDAIREQKIRAVWAYEGGAELRGEALERELERQGL